jgi:Tol biopolymer transport system component
MSRPQGSYLWSLILQRFSIGIGFAIVQALIGGPNLLAATDADSLPSLEHHKTILGTISSPIQVVQTAQGPMKFSNRTVDTIRSETVNGCRLALAVSNDPMSTKLHVLVDGQVVPGYDDVAWHSLVISPDGRHVAFVANKDGEQVCVLDGNPGQKFDEIGRQGTQFSDALAFSPDGQHLGFAARRNNNWLVVVDGVPGAKFDDVGGMEVTYHRKTTVNGFSRLTDDVFAGSSCPVFSPDGQHFLYLASRHEGTGMHYTVVFDGKPGLEFDRFFGANFSPDGHHVAYVGTTGNLGKVVYDGVAEIPTDGDGLLFSLNGSRYAYVTGKYGSSSHTVVVDGKPGPEFYLIRDLNFSPDGRHFVYTALSASGPKQLILDGTALPPMNGYRANYVTFSNDGKHIDYVAENGRDDAFIVDGKLALTFPPSTLQIVSPDGRRIAYAARAQGNQMHVILDGATGPMVNYIDQYTAKFSDDSRHFAYVARNKNRQVQVVVDGAAGPAFVFIAKNHPLFSPNGEHFAYAGRLGKNWQVVVDGKPGPELQDIDLDSIQFSPDGQRLLYAALIGQQQIVVSNTTPGPYFDEIRKGSLAFSPDGNHFAYVAKDGNNKWHAIFDGTMGPAFDSIGEKNVLFSSDSRHWAYVAQKDGLETLKIDGISGPQFSSIEVGPIQCKDGYLEYLAFEGNGTGSNLVRVTVPSFGPARP